MRTKENQIAFNDGLVEGIIMMCARLGQTKDDMWENLKGLDFDMDDGDFELEVNELWSHFT